MRALSVIILAMGLIGCGDDATPAIALDAAAVSDATDTTDAESAVEVEVADPPPTFCPKERPCYEGACCTCGPGTCEAGIDNALAALADLINTSIKDSLATGTLSLTAEFAGGDPAPGATFALNMYQTLRDPEDTKCNPAKERCRWFVDIGSFLDDCSVLVSFPNAKVEGTTLTAGGPDGAFELNVPVLGVVLKLQVVRARIEGKAHRDTDGNIYKIDGLLGGAIPRVLLQKALDDLPEEGLPITKSALKDLIESLVKDDVDALDADGKPGQDGVKESASMAFKFTGLPAELVGVTYDTYLKGKGIPAWLMDPCTSGAECGEGAGRCEPAEAGGDLVCLETCEGACHLGFKCSPGGDPSDPKGTCMPEYCLHPPATFSKIGFHISALSLGGSAKTGEGIDVDGLCDAPSVDGAGDACTAD